MAVLDGGRKIMKHPFIFRILLLALVLFAVSFAAFASDAVVYGNQNESIAAVQNRLKELGYFAGESAGIYDDEMKTSVANFQKANGLSVSGIADTATLEAIFAGNAVTKQEYIAMSTQGMEFDFTLTTGNYGKTVKSLQSFLNHLGFYAREPDGNFDAATEYAVRYFQLVNGLAVTGTADPETLNRITAMNAISVNPDPAQMTLRYGDEGSDVRSLQLTLQKLGYFTGDCSARYGKRTQEAVSAFQKSNRLAVTGECDLDTRLLLAGDKAISKEQADEIAATMEVKPGDVCEAVAVLKSRLNKLGYYAGENGEEYTEALKEAVKTFQTANKLKATGIADTQTRQLMNSEECLNMEQYTLLMSVCELKRGDSGYAVRLLQTRLTELGYFDRAVDGNYNKETENAVLYFQRGHDLPETGIANTQTRETMNRDDALNYDEAEIRYYARQEENERNRRIQTLCETAMNSEGKAYEAGKYGPELFGNAGFTYYCFKAVGIELAPTAAMQLENAIDSEAWNADVEKVDKGHLVFFKDAETCFTAICVGENNFVFASPSRNKVVAIENLIGMGAYEFVGSVFFF